MYGKYIDNICNKLMQYIVDRKHTNFDKHPSLLRNTYMANRPQGPML